jgi:SpoVK/Ycf46/Vps4 family AAA+-type ATPase
VDAASTKRLFKAVAKSGDAKLIELCRQIAVSEARKGRNVLSQRLNQILQEVPPEAIQSERIGKSVASLGEFALNSDKVPKSRRFKDPLIQLIPRDELRHHIVLPSQIQQRYDRVIKEYAARHRLAKHGLKYKKKILVYGPPGCGKTLSAEYLAWNTGLPLIKVRFDTLISSYFGESGANLRHVFDWASNTPSVLFLDECDFIAKSRTFGNDIGEVSRIVNVLLTLLEEYDSQGLLLAATNLTDTLDKALFRRFDEVFEVPMPSRTEIQLLLESSLSSMRVDSKLCLEEFSARLVGMPASAVVLLARDAAASVVLDGRDRLELSDLDAALENVRTYYRH